MKDSIAFYDSGIGGLTILQEVLELQTNWNLRYLADTAYMPLGQKSFIEIQERLKVVCDYLFRTGSNLVILACNTATVVAIRELQMRWLPEYLKVNQSWIGTRQINILGISKPLTENLVSDYWQYRDSPGLILATEATYRAGFYQAELLKYGFRGLQTVVCTNLATVIERQNQPEIMSVLKTVFEHIEVADSKLIILACTHYPIITNIIKTFLPSDCLVLDQTKATAHKLLHYINSHPEFGIGMNNNLSIEVTNPYTDFSTVARNLFKIEADVSTVKI